MPSAKPEIQILKDRIKNGIYIPEQVPRAAIQTCQDPRIIEAEGLLRGMHCSIPQDKSPEFTNKARTADRRAGRFGINKIVRPREESALQKWARQNQVLLKNQDFQLPWLAAGRLGESEHDVYPDSDNEIWVKRNNLSQHGTWLEYFHRLLLHNWLFPDTQLTFKGFVEHQGQLLPITTQKHIAADRGASEVEIDEFMREMGFTPIRLENPSRQFDYINTPLGIEVNDLHDENVLVESNKNVAIMDPVPMMEETSKIARILSNFRSAEP